MKRYLFPSILIFSILVSCTVTRKTTEANAPEHDNLLIAVAWFQHSAEMEALYYQGFNIARQRLDEALAAGASGKPLAVVVDVDETMLDNSPFETALINNTEEFAEGWSNWVSKASAKPLPGALDFALYAQSHKVDIFYITNRNTNEHASTLLNLRSAGFPDADERHLLTREDLSAASGNTSSKEVRRQIVTATHEIVVLIGDNLNDFSVVFEDRKTNFGKEAVENNRAQFGNKFIVLPNPMYGAWEKPLWDYREGLSGNEKNSLIKAKLRME